MDLETVRIPDLPQVIRLTREEPAQGGVEMREVQQEGCVMGLPDRMQTAAAQYPEDTEKQQALLGCESQMQKSKTAFCFSSLESGGRHRM